MTYFDASYLVRLYIQDPGFEAVRKLAERTRIACCAIGYAEVLGAFHRKLRDGTITASRHAVIRREFQRDSNAGAYEWFDFSPVILQRVDRASGDLAPNVFLRSADAIHLACAAENGFGEVYSNDRRFLDAAPHFGLRGVNVIEPS